ncbi:MAG: hypothetical protein HRU70_06450 [Phycisphaeraceae bacterium]|nr:MAG: hypothetical protein HRU70_06450 [Phycisphaeraceae bacterium]
MLMNFMNGRRRLALVALCGLALMSPLATPQALAQSGGNGQQGQQGSQEYVARWNVTTWTTRTRGQDLQAQIDLSRSTIQRDAYVFYEGDSGLYPQPGPHMIDADPGYMARHLEAFRRHVAAKIPDANASGYACIDWESWHPLWSLTPNTASNQGRDAIDKDFKNDWEEHILATRPNLIRGLTGADRDNALKRSYEEVTKRFFLDTLAEAKRFRPNIKWGFYGFPAREFYTFWSVRADPWKRVNETELTWLFSAVDVLFPTIYAVKVAVEGRTPDPARHEVPAEMNERFILDNVAEAVRVSQGKPVFAYVHFRYHPSLPRGIAETWVNEVNLRQQIELPKRAGAAGIMIWDCIESEQHFRDLDRIVQQQVIPRVDAVAVMPRSGNGPQLSSGPAPSGSPQQASASFSKAAASSASAKAAAAKATQAKAPVRSVIRLPNGRVVLSSQKPGGASASAPSDR